MPLGRAKIADRYPVGIAMSREQSAQRLQGVSDIHDGGGGFKRSPKAVEQMYVPLRFHIGPGRGANTTGAVIGSAALSGREYEPKKPSKLKSARRRG